MLRLRAQLQYLSTCACTGVLLYYCTTIVLEYRYEYENYYISTSTSSTSVPVGVLLRVVLPVLLVVRGTLESTAVPGTTGITYEY